MPVDMSQSGQSKLHTVGGHRPGGPTIACAELDDSDVRLACSYNAQPDSGAREAEAELRLRWQSATHMASLDGGYWGRAIRDER
jgi:hypothetical protein